MLYIWPFFAFFSLPLLLPYALPFINLFRSIYRSRSIARRTAIPTGQAQATAESSTNGFRIGESSKRRLSTKTKINGQAGTAQVTSSPNQGQGRSSALLTTIRLCQSSVEIWFHYLLATIVTSVAIVRFNTIIHPFTLADNRHYMFYVFRYTIRRSAWIRYGLVTAYTISRWMIWGTLRGCSEWIFENITRDCSMNHSYGRLRPAAFINHPFTYSNGGPQSTAPFPRDLAVESEQVQAEKQEQVDRALRDDPILYSTEPVSTSTTLVFLLATTLSLITAPLVEPRYFITPWVIWRLLIPAWRFHDHLTFYSLGDARGTNSIFGWFVGVFHHYDFRLLLETMWFVAINLGTIYVFLFKPYVWRAEDGTLLDNGRLQRFMW